MSAGGRPKGWRDDRKRCEMTSRQRWMEGERRGQRSGSLASEEEVCGARRLRRGCKSVIKSRLLLMYCARLVEAHWGIRVPPHHPPPRKKQAVVSHAVKCKCLYERQPQPQRDSYHPLRVSNSIPHFSLIHFP